MNKLDILEGRVARLEDDMERLLNGGVQVNLPDIQVSAYELAVNELANEIHITIYRVIKEYIKKNKLITEDGYRVEGKIDELIEKLCDL